MEGRDCDLESVSVVLLGAGFSAAATDGKMPLMSSFFDGLNPEEAASLHSFVRFVAGDVSTANVESVLLALDQIRTSPDAVLAGWADRWKAELPLLQRQLSRYTLNRLKDSLEIAQDNWAANLVAGCGARTTVISMNYDNIAERILSNREGIRHWSSNATCPHCKMRLLLQKACSCTGREEITQEDWRGALIKLHGSVAWKRCVNPDCCSYECLVADERCQPFKPCRCPHCGEECAPVLVMPTMSKNLSDTPEIAVMWQAARSAITEAESIFVFGFSMPTSDELLVQLIRSSIDTKRRLKRVAAVDLDPDGVISRFKRCIPQDCHVTTTCFKVDAGKTPAWLRRMV